MPFKPSPFASQGAVSRRRFLGTTGTLLALPFFASLVPRAARAAAAAPKRLMVYSVPNGLYMNKWTPTVAGAKFESTPLLAPLLTVRDYLLILTNTANRAAYQPNFPCDHARGTASMLTGTSMTLGTDHPAVAAISMDQVAAKTLGVGTTFNSLQLGISVDPDQNAADNNSVKTYNHAISWADTKVPLVPQTSPTTVFNNLFAGTSSAQSAADASLRQRYGTSVLDSALQQIKLLRLNLGSYDQGILDKYADGVREVELQLARSAPTCKGATAPTAADVRDTPTLSKQMHALMVLALQCDMTRVITYMAGPPEADRPYGFVNQPGGHHAYTHDTRANNSVLEINRWQMQQLGGLLAALQATPDVTGNLLDNTVLMMTSEIRGTEDGVGGGDHGHDRMPMLLAGKAGGKLATGRHVVFNQSDQPDYPQIHLTLLQALGVPATAFAGETRTLPQLGTV